MDALPVHRTLSSPAASASAPFSLASNGVCSVS